MKTKLALLALVTGLAMALVAPLATAQTSDGSRPKKPAATATKAKADPIQKRLDQLTKDYQLDEAQQAKVKTILAEQAAARKAIDADDSLDKAARAKKVRALGTETGKKITALLTPEQLEIQKKLREERAARNKK
ncbi:MAG: hypothetical protein LBK99_00400 [Opitutaceae bacterium]|jgi:hypothetical protein|nr:hypothetical protein [Opitutaceae bacterium]